MTRSQSARLAFTAVALFCLARAESASAAARECFFANDLSNWTDNDKGVLYLRVRVSDVYELQLLGSCPDLHWAERIGIETRGGSSQICSGLDVVLIVPPSAGSTTPQRCMASALHKLTPDEVRALPAKLRP